MITNLLSFLSRPLVLVVLLVVFLATGYSFASVQEAVQGPLLDMMMNGEAARERLAELTAEQKYIHLRATLINDMIYPLAYSGFFAGLAYSLRGKLGTWVALPAFIAAVTDISENTIQALALSGSADLLGAKSVLTPLKFGCVIVAILFVLGLALIALWRFIRRPKA